MFFDNSGIRAASNHDILQWLAVFITMTVYLPAEVTFDLPATLCR